MRPIVLTLLLTWLLAGPASAEKQKQTRPEQPIRQQSHYSGEQVLMVPDPIDLIDLEERIIYVHFRGVGFDVDDVVLESVLINQKIPAYTEDYPRLEDNWITTNCYLFRFLGSCCRPLPLETFTANFTVDFDLVSGEHVVMEGAVEVKVVPGDLNLDGITDADDLTFLADYLYHNGPPCLLEELMDLDRDWDVDVYDLYALEELLF